MPDLKQPFAPRKSNAIKKGQWMVRLDDRTTIWHFYCPFCDHGYSTRTFIKKDSCSNCGADMKEAK